MVVIMLSLCVVQGVDLVYSVPGLVVIIDKLARYLYDMNIAESEVQPQGEYNTVLYCTVLYTGPAPGRVQPRRRQPRRHEGHHGAAERLLQEPELRRAALQQPDVPRGFDNNSSKNICNALSKNIFSKLGCDYCFWTIHFRNRQQFLSGGQAGPGISTNTDNNLQHGVDSNLVCLFKNRWSQCPREIIRSVIFRVFLLLTLQKNTVPL